MCVFIFQAIFQQYPQPEKEYQSFSLLYNDRSLDLVRDNSVHSLNFPFFLFDLVIPFKHMVLTILCH